MSAIKFWIVDHNGFTYTDGASPCAGSISGSVPDHQFGWVLEVDEVRLDEHEPPCLFEASIPVAYNVETDSDAEYLGRFRDYRAAFAAVEAAQGRAVPA